MSTQIDLPPPPPMPPADLADAEFETPIMDTPLRTCPNCGAPAHGPFCYACGQSEKGMIRHLSEVVSDMADIVFNVDSRIFRSLWDLYVRPGYLTIEYLAGRRARYVTPFRLFFFLSIIAFFAIQASLPKIDAKDIQFDTNDSIEQAETPEQVNKIVEESLASLTVATNMPGLSARDRKSLDESMQKIRARGDKRVKKLEERASAVAAGIKVEEEKPDSGVTMFEIDGKPWDLKDNPVQIDWLSQALNEKLNDTLEHMKSNIENFRKDPGRLVAAWFSVLPQTLFVVMPLFAVLLKFFFLFKRRLYMEHLLVALHSHAFIFMSILVILGLKLLGGLTTDTAWLSQPLGWLQTLAWIWLFVYLFLMQKRVYRQGWIMTTMKFSVIGISYSFILGFALIAAGLISLVLT
jgi:flagellar motility protein MotE (MotC chaperone)